MIIQSTKEATREELIQRINELQDINEKHRILNGELREEINQLKLEINKHLIKFYYKLNQIKNNTYYHRIFDLYKFFNEIIIYKFHL